ncbi:MAG TPA: response regulator [bacterium]|jgi:DNA-binding NtrC family response regulator|nr:response regulator [bacterium]
MQGPSNDKIKRSDPDPLSLLKNSYFTILVLDSNYSIDSTLEEFLSSEGYPVLMADSEEEALAKTRRFEPSLILLDCELRGLRCLALLPELLAENPYAAVVLLADKPSIASVVEAMNLGVADFFERPLDLERLKRLIERQKTFFENRSRELN